MAQADVDAALAKLLLALRDWRNALTEVRCDCGRRIGRRPEDVLLAHRLARYDAAKERHQFDSEAPTVPKTPPRKRP